MSKLLARLKELFKRLFGRSTPQVIIEEPQDLNTTPVEIEDPTAPHLEPIEPIEAPTLPPVAVEPPVVPNDPVVILPPVSSGIPSDLFLKHGINYLPYSITQSPFTIVPQGVFISNNIPNHSGYIMLDGKWIRYHLGKEAKDIIWATNGDLQDRIEQGHSGCTIIIPKGFYDRPRDHMMVGYYGNGSVNGRTPNGTTSNLTTIMAEEPLGVIIDRKNMPMTSRMLGNQQESSSNGLRVVSNILMTGFAWRNVIDGVTCERTTNCWYDLVSVIQSAEEKTVANPYFFDGGIYSLRAVRGGGLRRFSGMSNSRFGVIISSGSPGSLASSTGYVLDRGLMTSAAAHGYQETMSQTYCAYGSRNANWNDLISVDSFLYPQPVNNVRDKRPMSRNFSFIETNGAADALEAVRLVSMNDVRSGFSKNNQNNLPCHVSDSLFWNNYGMGYSQIHGSGVTFDDCAMDIPKNLNKQWAGHNHTVTGTNTPEAIIDSLNTDWITERFMEERRTYKSYGITGNRGISATGVNVNSYLKSLI